MQSLSSILLLVERGDRVHDGVNKALLLARHFRARLELFLCDTEHYVTCRRDRTSVAMRTEVGCIAEGREYLEALRKTIVAPDVAITTEAVCDLSLHDGVAAKLARTPIDLIVKAAEASRRDTSARGAADWSAVALCAAPLLLTRGRPWQPVPRFAAIVPARELAACLAGGAVAELAKVLAGACGAQLDLLAAGTAPSAGSAAKQGAKRLRNSTASPAPVCADPPPLHSVPDERLPAFVVEHDYDLVVVGKSRHGPEPVLSTLAGRILGRISGDVVLAHERSLTAP